MTIRILTKPEVEHLAVQARWAKIHLTVLLLALASAVTVAWHSTSEAQARCPAQAIYGWELGW